MFFDMSTKGQEGILVLNEVTFEVLPKIFCNKPLVKSGFCSLYALRVWRKQQKVTCYYKSWDKLYNIIHGQVRNFDYLCCSIRYWPITVTVRSKVRTVFACSNTGIVGSNPTNGMAVCVHLFCVCAVLCAGRGLAPGWSPVQGVLPTVWKVKRLKKKESRPNKGL
jgi:hypothetical protein